MRTWGLILAAIVLAADQASKWWIVHEVMDPPRVIPVTGFFNLVLTGNRGISFGLFSGAASPYVFAAIAAVIVIGLLIWLGRVENRWLAAAVGLIIGGALGNLWDRLALGYVVDFLDFHAGGWHWPAFNLADAAITIGVAALFIDAFFGRREA